MNKKGSNGGFNFILVMILLVSTGYLIYSMNTNSGIFKQTSLQVPQYATNCPATYEKEYKSCMAENKNTVDNFNDIRSRYTKCIEKIAIIPWTIFIVSGAFCIFTIVGIVYNEILLRKIHKHTEDLQKQRAAFDMEKRRAISGSGILKNENGGVLDGHGNIQEK
jgi:hypothetical protein